MKVPAGTEEEDRLFHCPLPRFGSEQIKKGLEPVPPCLKHDVRNIRAGLSLFRRIRRVHDLDRGAVSGDDFSGAGQIDLAKGFLADPLGFKPRA